MLRVILLFLLALIVIDGYAAETVNIGKANITSDVLGKGFGGLNSSEIGIGSFLSDCIVGEHQINRQSRSSIRLFTSINENTFIQDYSINGSANLSFWIVGARGAARYLFEEATTNTKESNLFHFKVGGVNTRFDSNTMELNRDISNPQLCGDRFVSQVSRGVEHKLIASLEFFESSVKKDFKASATISLFGGLIKKKKEYSSENREYLENAVMTITHYSTGLLSEELLRIRDYQQSPYVKYYCTYQMIDYCIEKANEYYNYLSSQEFIASVSDQDSYSTDTITLSKYEEAGLKIPSDDTSEFSIVDIAREYTAAAKAKNIISNIEKMKLKKTLLIEGGVDYLSLESEIAELENELQRLSASQTHSGN
ncbi:hypothetical protein [Saccharospirillum salsuginis]|uniref:Uncharacterized protein n=1 Tax=Saccharospirillum salsuginis TaxID=418750 RepID=A0A918K2F4_9GAMM|nr:hypothetical protein [Saccharospirillum salsuginis]GGX39715.1 hypothetical protein GCM10007392_02780 [Saccharospirillum salsuginis]